MITLPRIRTSRFLLFRRMIIFVLAGLLIYYHIFTLCDLYIAGNTNHTRFEYLQSGLRVIIVLSLLIVVLGKRWALCGMWGGITGLIATHYWAHFGNLPVDFTQGRHPLSYLKGFIFPSIITMAFHTSRQVGDSNADA